MCVYLIDISAEVSLSPQVYQFLTQPAASQLRTYDEGVKG